MLVNILGDVVATFISDECKKQGISYRDISAQTGVSSKSIAKIKKGEAVRMDTVATVLELLGYQMELSMNEHEKQGVLVKVDFVSMKLDQNSD